MSVEAIILGGGKGSRMHTAKPKPLHAIGGRPMLAHVVAAVTQAGAEVIHIVVAKSVGESPLPAALEQDFAAYAPDSKPPIHWVAQDSPLGTGHAAQVGIEAVADSSQVLILYADTPLIRAQTLADLLRLSANGEKLGLLVGELAEPHGLGRILRDKSGAVVGIVEQKDASPAEQKIRECNLGFISGNAAQIKTYLRQITNTNAQHEYYLTDLIAHAHADRLRIATCTPTELDEALGVNSMSELARAERVYQRRMAESLLAQGVTLLDPARLDIRGQVEFGRDCVVDINVILEGRVRVGANCRIGAGAIIRNSVIGDGCVIEANCQIENARLGENCVVGPFARLRPGSELGAAARVGNFVEIKNSRLGPGAKANHLSYLGDAELGAAVNIGAGVITCNYDGAQKHPTQIGDHAFIGSNSQLVAPLRIGRGATIGAGSTITADVEADELAVGRARQRAVKNWQRPKKSVASGGEK